MNHSTFVPHHINATNDDFDGNNGIGRYVFLPGSDGRAKEIAQHFNNLQLKSHPRGHNLYLGNLTCHGKNIDVAAISSGMGCPSLEIIIHELFHLGAKRFLRVGTAGSLQPDFVKIGDIVHALGSVRDENTTTTYAPIEVPAISSYEFMPPIIKAAEQLALTDKIHSGIVHCKSSFYAREFGAGPKASENQQYINLLTPCGVLATEMETAALFIQSQLYNQQLRHHGQSPAHRVLASAILGIIAVPPHLFAPPEVSNIITHSLIHLALESVKNLASSELMIHPNKLQSHAIFAADTQEQYTT